MGSWIKNEIFLKERRSGLRAMGKSMNSRDFGFLKFWPTRHRNAAANPGLVDGLRGTMPRNQSNGHGAKDS